MKKINWEVIEKITDRAESMDLLAHDQVLLELDLGFVADQYNMDWERLLAADSFNFSHDIVGIQNHIDRETCKLKNNFVPRFVKAKVKGEVKNGFTQRTEKRNS